MREFRSLFSRFFARNFAKKFEPNFVTFRVTFRWNKERFFFELSLPQRQIAIFPYPGQEMSLPPGQQDNSNALPQAKAIDQNPALCPAAAGNTLVLLVNAWLCLFSKVRKLTINESQD